MINGFGTSLLSGAVIGTAALSGLKQMGIGAVTGFAVGGIVQGVQSAFQGKSFLTGKWTEIKTTSTKTNVTTTTQRTIQERGIKYPPNDGFIGTTQEIELQPGTIVDRYGGTSNSSRFLAPKGTPIEMRSLSPNTNINLYDKYQVIQPFRVQSGIVAPWFGQSGMGTQYVTPETIKTLLKEHYIIKLK